MGKVICEICGTSYNENATQCPICGSANTADIQAILGETATTDSSANSGYTYVKGGRFSTSNVRKRTRSVQTEEPQETPDDSVKESMDISREAPRSRPVRGEIQEDKPARRKKKPANKGLIATVFVLLLLVVAVAVYIALRFFLPVTTEIDPHGSLSSGDASGDNSGRSETISCLSITVDQPMIELTEDGQTYQISYIREPVNTTDPVTFTSSDPKVAKVDDSGVITAISSGRSIITITCGDVSAQCAVTCVLIQKSDDQLQFNRETLTFDTAGDTFQLYNGTLDMNQIAWSSDDEDIAVFENGIVTAVGPGVTTVYAEYQGTEVRCVVTCSFTVEDETDPPETTAEPVDTNCNIKTEWGTTITDITMRIGEQLNIYLVDSSGNRVSAQWSITGNCAEIGENYIKAISSGTVTLTATYGGKTFECLVRVR